MKILIVGCAEKYCFQVHVECYKTLCFHFQNLLVRGAIQNYVDFFCNFKTENQPYMKLGIHFI